MDLVRRYMIWAVVGLGVLVVIAAVAGAMMEAEHTVTRQATYARTPEEVWKVITRFDKTPQWRSTVDAVTIESGDPIRFIEIGDQGPLPLEVSEQLRPQRLVLKADDPTLPFNGTWTFELTPTDGGTRLSVTEHARVSNVLFRFVARVLSDPAKTPETYLVDLGRRLGEDVVPQAPTE